MREIIAFWLYMIRKEAGLDDYGSSDTDQAGAEHIIRFFENMKEEGSRDWQWEKTYEDYKMFQSIYEEIDDIP